jgi:hypothetical protein
LGVERKGKNSYDVGDKEKKRNRKLKVNNLKMSSVGVWLRLRKRGEKRIFI